MRFISELRCKGSKFFANRQTFQRKFSCKGQKSWFRRASLPVAGHPWLPSRAGSTGSGRWRLGPADSKSGKQSAWQQNGIRLKSNDQFGFKSIYKSRRHGAMRAGGWAKRPILGRGSARFGAQQGPFHCPKQPLPPTRWLTGGWRRGPVCGAGAKYPYNAGRATGVAGESLNN